MGTFSFRVEHSKEFIGLVESAMSAAKSGGARGANPSNDAS
jgi:hypothetical protein